ncbi:DNA helicase PIF1, ATP-dependent [Corchorus olitorius]|uniref:ATP-dependent DNA helicase n=1 Tax=Corchorus olitorius TaxID=93759 RepID=A0A1R3KCT0_9ROSI|nr:DNA helicase PIF1, ATP-dependent [Corchorus olitorius]
MVKKKKGPPRTPPPVQTLQARANRHSRGRILRQRKRGGLPIGPPNSFFLSSVVGNDGELITQAFQFATVPGLSESINSRFSGQIPAPCSTHTPYSADIGAFLFERGSCSRQNTPPCNFVRSHNTVYQAEASGTIFAYQSFGGLDTRCHFCKARMWMKESVQPKKRVDFSVFSLCYKQGQVSLPEPKPTPLLLDDLLNHDTGVPIFLELLDRHHRIGSLLPLPGNRPKFAQLYIYDTQNESTNRIEALMGGADSINRIIVDSLITMLDGVNEIVKAFRTARDRFEQEGFIPMKLRLIRSRDTDNRTYSAPSSTDIAGLIVNDPGVNDGNMDIIVEHKTDGMKRISNVHPLYMAMQYPLLFPYGEDGFRVGIRYVDSPLKEDAARKTVSMREYYAYIIQQRHDQHNTLLRGGRLFQQFLVDAECCITRSRLAFIRSNQKKIRVDMYKQVSDAIHAGDTHGDSIGKRVVLPPTFTGGPRYMYQNYQDAIAICRNYGFPDLFITFTCNGNWPEIQAALSFIPGQRPEDRPDIVARVFKLKVDDLMEDLMKNDYFDKAIAVTYTIEFQKRGLPHVHILLWLENSASFRTPARIDQFISAELPDNHTDSIGYEAVKQFMMHGPCYHVYRRRDTGIVCNKNGIELDNRFVVPHNVDLVVKYRVHINVEVCNHSRVIKYLFKYINKGPDRVRVIIESDDHTDDSPGSRESAEGDEIKAYMDCRYLCPYEAAWRLFGFPIHHREPAMTRLPVHLPHQHNVCFRDGQPLQQVLNRIDIDKTMLTEWFMANQKYEAAREYLYAEFPTAWVWHADDSEWVPRQRGRAIGRVVHIHPSAGELYYLRLLLNVVRGPKSFEHLRTVDGVLHQTYQQACEALGLLGDDKQWQHALDEAAHWANAKHLRQFFVQLLLFSQVTNPAALFEKNWQIMSDDIQHRFDIAVRLPNYALPPPEALRNYVLLAIGDLLAQNCSSLAEKNLPQPTMNTNNASYNRLIHEEHAYNLRDLRDEHDRLLNTLNPEQRDVYLQIRHSVDNSQGRIFFVYGHGGTGKTYLWKTIIAGVRSSSNIVLAVASLGIASLLLPGGRTAHSRFKIPLTPDEWSTCQVKKGTQLAALLQQTHMIVWDEAPMIHRHCFEALDKTLRDIMAVRDESNQDKPFGGLTVVFGGDFRQILPVIPQGTKSDILDATICYSKI